MTGLRLIGIAPPRSTLVEGAIACGGFVAFVEPGDDVLSVDAVKAHHRAVLRHLALGPFLPAAAGVIYADAADLRSRLLQQSEQIEFALLRSEGCVEWSLRYRPDPHDEPADMNGRAYLRARLGAQHRLQAARDAGNALCDRLIASALVDDAVMMPAADNGLSLGLLVRVEGAGQRLVTVATEAARLWPCGTIRSSGPWPTYSFSPLRSSPGQEARQ